MENFFAKIFGSKNSRELKRLSRIVETINSHEKSFEKLSDLSDETRRLQKQIRGDWPLSEALPEAFALVREASKRTLGLRHFDVQMIGGIVLHEGRIAEMRTGEGKTLVATLPVYLNALSGFGVHVVTVNDYLAKRDADWMKPIYQLLGLTVGVIQSGQSSEEKKAAYNSDITYGTNNEFGFDYLRSNMAFATEDRLQRRLNFVLIDEVDSILIDEARTPLIISGPSEENTSLYLKLNRMAPEFVEQPFDDTPRVFGEERPEATGDFSVDEKNRQIELTELGHQKAEESLMSLGLLEAGESLYSPSNLNLLHHVHAALKAHHLFKRDVHYMIENNEIVIVDEHTDRSMPGRRWSDGIHQAVEAKENVQIQNESQTLASTTFQNYFRLYQKISGMTGTADTEAYEFKQIYGLDVVVVPTHRPMIRRDENDLVYMNLSDKYQAIVEDVRSKEANGQPVLIGTASIESSELLSVELTKCGIKHNVLNAKQHEREADIVADAGRAGSVTIATNMAGRGTDIVLGGSLETDLSRAGDNLSDTRKEEITKDWSERNKKVIDSGGLHIIGTERHESRRIDNQLRGRSGRQGDPGSSRFYLSLEDNLMRIFVTDGMRGMMQRLGGEEGEAIEHRMIDRSIENAQRKVEGHNFDIRKNLLEYDDVANDQRQVIYQQRLQVMDAEDISDTIEGLVEEIINDTVFRSAPPNTILEEWDLGGLEQALSSEFSIEFNSQDWIEGREEVAPELIAEDVQKIARENYQEKSRMFESSGIDIRIVEKQLLLQILDQRWKEHLAAMDQLRQGIHLRAYAQKQPKQEYKRESFELFQDLLFSIKYDVVKTLQRMVIEDPEKTKA
ncbi:MAG: preprotein translocase subunit SecA, partial [Pseudomonadota bacterium]|nr:preprotein translocase subunit SecA [Pseudomonadota bacterium]